MVVAAVTTLLNAEDIMSFGVRRVVEVAYPAVLDTLGETFCDSMMAYLPGGKSQLSRNGVNFLGGQMSKSDNE